jgi:cell wall-associated NlpC family hydrolase
VVAVAQKLGLAPLSVGKFIFSYFPQHIYLGNNKQVSSCTYDVINKKEIMFGIGNALNYSKLRSQSYWRESYNYKFLNKHNLYYL